MSLLLGEIRRTNPEAASKLEEADFCTDSDIRSLCREDLHELFPGVDSLKLRKTILGIIHKRKPVNVLLKELRDFIPDESFKAALTNNGVLVEYLHILKDMKAQMNYVQTFLDAHIGLLEGVGKTQPDQEPEEDSLPSTSTSAACCPVETQNGQSDGHQQGAHGNTLGTPSWDQQGVTYQMVVSGETFDAHLRLLEKVKAQTRNQFHLVECSQDSQITIVFCPICSRTQTDVEAALIHVTGENPIILVLMHHAYEVRHVTSQRTWPENKDVVLQVNVFYHETMCGLLKCQQNDDAASQIQNKLQDYMKPIRNHSSGDGQAASSSTDRHGLLGMWGSWRGKINL